VENYNDSSKVLGGKFDQGRYKKTDYRKSITIYHFNDRDMLTRVLAHELGHALGLKHNNNQRAIMYHLNQFKTVELAPEDIAALKEHCN
jgi:predicted Zn-dependent protease